MAAEDRRISLAGKVLVDKIDAQLLDATTDADPAWRDQVLGLIRLALDLKRGEQ
jgi:hypothetical protein